MTALRQPVPRLYSTAEYLALEGETGEKYEFFDGEVYLWEAMAGSTPPHAMICSELSSLINQKLDRKRCNSFNSDLKLAITELNRYRYPDLTVICGPLEYDEEITQAIVNPTCLVEVTSESSKEADYTSKAKQYMEHIPSLRDYLVVVQDERFVSLFSRKEEKDEWQVKHYAAAEDIVRIDSVEVEMTLAEIYRNIVWKDGEAVIELGG